MILSIHLVISSRCVTVFLIYLLISASVISLSHKPPQHVGHSQSLTICTTLA